MQFLNVNQLPNFCRKRSQRVVVEVQFLQIDQLTNCCGKGGELVAADEVKKQAYQVGRSIREALANLADRLSHQLAGETDAMVIHKMLSEEHRDALLALIEAER